MRQREHKNKSNKNQGEPQVFRVRLPRNNEVIGVLEQRLGANHMLIRCLDGKSRNCRVPGRLKRKLWLREGDVVLVEPWELGGDERGDIIWKYNPAEVDWLRRRGLLRTDQAEF